MKTPKFWNKKNILSRCLLPCGKIYSAATFFRLKFSSPKKVDVPVICIGNLTAGGTGKTPVAVSVAQILQKNSYNPMFVSRGYGGKLSGIAVNPKIHTAADVGDEPLLLARQAPVYINSNRFFAASDAQKNGADVIVMDDGFQNPTLYKDISFLVFDGTIGIGNTYPLPAGPLRENFDSGMERASAAIIIGDDKQNLEKKLKDIPVFRGKIISYLPELSSNRVIAFAGIGRPQKFYDSLISHGLKIEDTIDFPDHHVYKISELRNMVELAQTAETELITTAKDFVKIPPELQSRFKVLEIKIQWENEKALEKFILNKITHS